MLLTGDPDREPSDISPAMPSPFVLKEIAVALGAPAQLLSKSLKVSQWTSPYEIVLSQLSKQLEFANTSIGSWAATVDGSTGASESSVPGARCVDYACA